MEKIFKIITAITMVIVITILNSNIGLAENKEIIDDLPITDIIVGYIPDDYAIISQTKVPMEMLFVSNVNVHEFLKYNSINKKSKEKIEIEQEREAKILYEQSITAYACENVINPYEGYITEYMNLNNRKDITKDQMKMLIETYTVDYPNSEFIGTEQAFIDASKQTGLDPIFLFALAGVESGWDVSDLHASKNNPYSINMTDINPGNGYYMGDTFYEGIVNGAVWINENYYENGYCTLYEMIYGGRRYASSDRWMPDIVYIMNQCYNELYKK